MPDLDGRGSSCAYPSCSIRCHPSSRLAHRLSDTPVRTSPTHDAHPPTSDREHGKHHCADEGALATRPRMLQALRDDEQTQGVEHEEEAHERQHGRHESHTSLPVVRHDDLNRGLAPEFSPHPVTGESVWASRARSQRPSGCSRYTVMRYPASCAASPPARGVTDSASRLRV